MTDKKDEREARHFVLPMAELIDRLTVNHIKLAKLKGDKKCFHEEIKKISEDIDQIISNKNIALSADVIRMIIVISQMNLHIWNNKDEMQANLENEPEYLRLLKLAHQLNGIRNSMKNALLEKEGTVEASHIRSNFETDGLDWDFEL
jgi:hypothetical protein